MKAKPIPKVAADHIPPVTYSVAMAVRALRDGVASDSQQKLALNWILEHACEKLRFPYHSTDRDTSFALGRRFVADQITGLFYLDISKLRTDDVEA